MLFYTADLHLGHTNIIKYCQRPFTDITEHNNELIARWNNKVHPTDTVYILGDFCLTPKQQLVHEWFDQLNGNIYIVPGNHDQWIKKFEAWPRHHNPIIFNKQVIALKDNGTQLTLSHYPRKVWDGMNNDVWQLYGHVHNSIEWEPDIEHPYMVNVGVDVQNYEPVSLEEILTQKYKTVKKI